jgi:L,D-transpeptidase ErfK/SrfK
MRYATAVLLAGCVWMSACSLFGPSAEEREAAARAKLPPARPAPVLAVPKANHKHELADEHQDIVGYVQKTTVGDEDTLPDIARRFDVGYEEMLLANPGVDPWLPGKGKEVVVPTEYVLPVAPREGVVVNIAAMRVFYFPTRKRGEKQIVYTHPIGIGRVGWQTPEGTTKIVARVKDPVWVVPKSVHDEHAQDGEILPKVVPAGPDNPLGAHMFRLGWSSYLMHGTNKPYGVGMRSSHGCIRLYPEDIAALFDMVPLGTKFTVVNQPYLLGARDSKLYLQAYAPLEDDKRDWDKNSKRLLERMFAPKLRKKMADRSKDIDWKLVNEIAHKPRAIATPVTGANDGMQAVLEHAPLVADVVPADSNWDGKTGLLVDEKTFKELLGDQKPATKTPATETAPMPTAGPAPN